MSKAQNPKKTYEVKDTLPDKLSDLIDVALEDLRQVEEDPLYGVAMSIWHSYLTEDKKCFVCLAGAVLSKSLNFPIQEKILCADQIEPSSVQRKLNSLDHFRSGRVSAAVLLFYSMGESTNGSPWYKKSDPPFKRYEDDADQWKAWAKAAASNLREVGL